MTLMAVLVLLLSAELITGQNPVQDLYLVGVQNTSIGVNVTLFLSEPTNLPIEGYFVPIECAELSIRCNSFLVLPELTASSQYTLLTPLTGAVLILNLRYSEMELKIHDHFVKEFTSSEECNPIDIIQSDTGTIYLVCVDLARPYMAFHQINLNTTFHSNTTISAVLDSIIGNSFDVPPRLSNFEYVSTGGNDPMSQRVYFTTGRYMFHFIPLTHELLEIEELPSCGSPYRLTTISSFVIVIAAVCEISNTTTIVYIDTSEQSTTKNGLLYTCPNTNTKFYVHPSAQQGPYIQRQQISSYENIALGQVVFESAVCFSTGTQTLFALLVYSSEEDRHRVVIIDDIPQTLEPSIECPTATGCDPLQVFCDRYLAVLGTDTIILDLMDNSSLVLEAMGFVSELEDLICIQYYLDEPTSMPPSETPTPTGTNTTTDHTTSPTMTTDGFTTTESTGIVQPAGDFETTTDPREASLIIIIGVSVPVSVILLVVVVVVVISAIVYRRFRRPRKRWFPQVQHPDLNPNNNLPQLGRGDIALSQVDPPSPVIHTPQRGTAKEQETSSATFGQSTTTTQTSSDPQNDREPKFPNFLRCRSSDLEEPNSNSPYRHSEVYPFPDGYEEPRSKLSYARTDSNNSNSGMTHAISCTSKGESGRMVCATPFPVVPQQPDDHEQTIQHQHSHSSDSKSRLLDSCSEDDPYPVNAEPVEQQTHPNTPTPQPNGVAIGTNMPIVRGQVHPQDLEQGLGEDRHNFYATCIHRDSDSCARVHH